MRFRFHLGAFSVFSVTVAFLSFNTSRAARGGGGSFKNRKPIGKIRCCESQMSDQKQLVS